MNVCVCVCGWGGGCGSNEKFRFVCLFVCLIDWLILYVPSTIFQGRIFLGWTSTKLVKMCLAQGPQRSDAGEARTRGPLVSSQALYHWATPSELFVIDLFYRDGPIASWGGGGSKCGPYTYTLWKPFPRSMCGETGTSTVIHMWFSKEGAGGNYLYMT